MLQTFYIESDEEIISVIGRLRHSSGEVNYFIFPKRSLVLQSTINLKLLQREAEKLGKRVVIVTQDDMGIALAEKAGLATERYTDDFAHQIAHMKIAAPAPENVAMTSGADKTTAEYRTSEHLGSNEFYVSPGDISVPQTTVSEKRVLRVRNASPPKQTSLNSQRTLPLSIQDTLPIHREQHATRAGTAPLTGLVRSASPAPEVARTINRNAASESYMPMNEREMRLKNFYTHGDNVSALSGAPSVKTAMAVPTETIVSSKMRWIPFLLGGIAVVSLIGVGTFLFLPRAEVQVIPYKMTRSVDLPFDGYSEGVLTSDTALPVRMVVQEHEVVVSVDATGTSSGVAQKARGAVIIYNSFSAEPQSLVATTRFESTDGKVFRLVEGVIVPGMTGNQPGATEAQVIADQPGPDYNISPTTFTIPGFQGSRKFDKFSAKSNKMMTGGSQATSSDFQIISKADLDKAEVLAKEQAKEAYKSTLMATLSAGERILEEGLEIVPRADSSLPTVGTVATSFEYKGTFSVRGFIFSESAIKDIIMKKGEETINGVVFRPTAIALSYGEAVPDYEGKKVRLKVRAIVDAESVIDQEKLLSGILGKDSDGVNEVLTAFPAIKKIEIIFKPQWFISSVPSAKNRVTITVMPGSAD